jgi:hypothetical protein
MFDRYGSARAPAGSRWNSPLGIQRTIAMRQKRTRTDYERRTRLTGGELARRRVGTLLVRALAA